MPLSRRRFLFGTAVLATTVVGLSACNASAGSDTTTGEAAPSAAATGVEEGAYPVTIEHKWGSTTIDSARQRVVIAGYKEQDDCLALGVVPVATTAWFDLGGSEIVGPWATAALGDAPPPTLLKDADGIDFEADRRPRARPDHQHLLRTGGGRLRQAQRDRTDHRATEGRGGLERLLGRAGDHGRAGAGPTAADDRPDRGREEEGRRGRRGESGVRPGDRGRRVRLRGHLGLRGRGPRSRLLTDLGFRRPDGLDAAIGGQWGGDLSDEKVDLLDVGALIWLYEGNGRQQIEANKAYASLPVHTQGRDLFSGPGDGMYEAFSFLTVLSLGYLVDKLVPRLKNAVDGDPEHLDRPGLTPGACEFRVRRRTRNSHDAAPGTAP